jgi:hypothetical protein
MLYLAPDRRGAAVAILSAASLIGLMLMLAAYFLHAGLFWQALLHAKWLDISVPALRMQGAYWQVIKEVAGGGPVLILLVPAALIIYVIWRRSRYFGNAAPLIMSFLFLGLRLLSPHDPESIYTLAAIIFLFVFVAGVAADLLETKAREQVAAVLIGLLAANGLWNLIGLARIAR